jgi:AraC family transcriptional regulator
MNTEQAVRSPLRAGRWYASLPSPVLAAELDRVHRVMLRHFRDTGPSVEQPPLDDSILVIHLGGAKRVTRAAARHVSVHEVEAGSLTLMPALHAYRWTTEGPIDYAHLSFGHGLLHQVALEEYDRAPADLSLHESVGFQSPLVAEAMLALLADMRRPSPSRLLRESLLTAITCTLLRDHSSLSGTRRLEATGQTRGGLPGWALGRVVSYMEAHLSQDIGIADLVALTGLSRAQFFRAFKQSTGLSPGAYLATLRRARAGGGMLQH